jgi:hypothetical protein
MGAARLYKASTPYNAADLRDLDYEQSADVMYFAHINYPPTKLTRAGHTSWTFSTVTFGPTITPPTGVAASASAATGEKGYSPRTYSYVVTSIDDDTAQESRASAVATATNDLTLAGNYNTVSWAPVDGAERYTVYKGNNGVYGYIGTTEQTTFQDGPAPDAIAGDLTDTPPLGDNPFVGADNYPSTVTFYEQRLMWGRTKARPNGVWGSQSSSFENMDKSRPTKADDAISFSLVAGRVNAVNQLASVKSLLALTSDAVFAIGSQDEALTPSNIVSRRQTGRGSSRLGPLIIDNVVFFRPSQGSSVRTLGYTFESDGYQSNNMAIFSPHFFDGFDIVAWAYQQEPYACIWAARDDGALLCFTWEQEQQVWGWTLCETAGKVEDVCVITEGGVDRLYLAVRRTLAGREDVFIERMALPLLVAENLPDACYLDCAVTQKFAAPTREVAGLWHLEGETVSAFHDGNVTTDYTVKNGRIMLPAPATIVTVGLPYSGVVETLPLVLGQTNHAKRQMISKVVIRVDLTRGISAGAGGGALYAIKQRQGEAIGDPIALASGDFDVQLQGKWNAGATVVVEQTNPLPATISALFPEVVVTE